MNQASKSPLGGTRTTARAFFVIQTVNALGEKAQRPFADMPFAELDLSGGGGKRVPLGSQQDGPRPFGQAHRRFLSSEPSRQGGADVLIDLHP